MATLSIPHIPINPYDDANKVHAALKGSGSNSTAVVIDILSQRDATQRALIQREYKNLFQEELKKVLSSELSGHLKKAVLLWMPDPVLRDVFILRHALTGAVNDVRVATEVICSRTPSQLRQIKQVYYSTYSHNLDHDIRRHTSGDHKKLLLAYVNILRYEGPGLDGTLVEGDARSLYQAGEKKKLVTDVKTFIAIFSERSRAHLAAVCSAYHRFGKSLEKAVKHETSGHMRFGLLTILRCAENPGRYFAKLFRRAMKGIKTDDRTLIRIVVTRCELDLQFIKFEYRKRYKKLLHESVHSVTSGNYRAFLHALLGPTH